MHEPWPQPVLLRLVVHHDVQALPVADHRQGAGPVDADHRELEIGRPDVEIERGRRRGGFGTARPVVDAVADAIVIVVVARHRIEEQLRVGHRDQRAVEPRVLRKCRGVIALLVGGG